MSIEQLNTKNDFDLFEPVLRIRTSDEQIRIHIRLQVRLWILLQYFRQ
jgi:hypothetical protein